jgi:hypothetical protein
MAEKDIDVRNLLNSGQRLPAMNLYHERYGGELEEVRANIEEMEADDGITGYFPNFYRWEHITDPEFRDLVEATLRQGNLLTSIRLCREHLAGPLKYAKQAVLSWQVHLGLEHLPQDREHEDSIETFDIRWHYTLHPDRKRLFSKPIARHIEFRFELQVADHSIPDLSHGDAVSWYDLVASKMSDGEYGIFTCGCGVMGCGGFSPVEVIHLDTRTIWLEQGQWHVFDVETYRAAIGRVEKAIQELSETYPAVPIELVLDGPSI